MLVIGAMALAPWRALLAQAKLPSVGFLASRSREMAVEVTPFLQGMRELGYVEGKNVRYEWRFADGRYDRLPALAQELVRLRVDVIAASSTPSVQAAQRATKEIPIVMVSAADPVGLGFVASLSRPGGNITGVSNVFEGTWEKQLDVLMEVLPTVKRVALLVNPDELFTDAAFKTVSRGAARRGVEIRVVEARGGEEIDQAFATMKQRRSQAVIVAGGSNFMQQRARLARLAAEVRLPAIYYRREYVESGGLMSYGRDASISYRRAAAYVDRVLRGAKPADLPIDQASVIELVLNQSAARGLGVVFPGKLLVRADKIIE